MDAETIALSPPRTRRSPRPAERLWAEAAPSPPDGRPQQPWRQRAVVLLTVGVCVAAAVWYVPRIISEDSRTFTGTVTSSGVVGLNFDRPGYLSSVDVSAGQVVQRGQMLAAEYAPASKALLSADQAAIISDQAKLAELRAAPVADQEAEVAAAKAQLAKDEAQQVSDRTEAAATQIVAPSPGTVVAVNGQPGETVTNDGIRIGSALAQPAQSAQRPLFSLLPEGPQASSRTGGGGSNLPVIALRTSTTWHVVALIPESSVSGIRTGQPVTITVPAANVTNIQGKIQEIMPTPVATSNSVDYQAVVSVAGHAKVLPLDGMAADIRLGS